MALVYVGSISNSGTSGTDIDPGGEPGGVIAGDLGFYFFVAQDGATHALPSGWTEIAAADNSQFDARVGMIVRGASTPDLTTTVSTSVYREADMIFIRGADTTTPLDVSVVELSDGPENDGIVVDPPPITPNSNDCMIVVFIVSWNNGLSDTWTPSTGYTRRTVTVPNAASGIQTRLLSGGAGVVEDPSPVSTLNSTNAKTYAVTVAVRPAAGAGTGGTVVAIGADGVGDVPSPVLGAGANISATPAGATGDIPGNFPVSASADAVASDAVGDVPAPAVSGGSSLPDATVVVIPADAVGDVAPPNIRADVGIQSPTFDAVGDLVSPTPGIGDGSNLSGVYVWTSNVDSSEHTSQIKLRSGTLILKLNGPPEYLTHSEVVSLRNRYVLTPSSGTPIVPYIGSPLLVVEPLLAGSAVGPQVGAYRVVDEAGNIIGFLPIYSSFTE